ncbi:MAG: hypothetical protein JEZ09_07425 [Salinivirgaceae bacterium]|nr:hypothetical protein [Salinivirgaceae bacterium]
MKLFQLVFILSILTLIYSCKNNTKKDAVDDINNIEFDAESEQDKTITKIFLNLPSPIELTNTILSTKNPYNPELLNPVEKVNNYSTTAKLALNFGIFGADLCYCRVYDQLQSSISYLSAIRKLSEKLQIPEEEGAETINRIEENMSNRDSIFHIISETYANADGYLKENERDLTATFILIGGWVEGMHFAVNLIEENSDNLILINKIAEQKYSYQNLMSLLEGAKDNSALIEIYPLFEKLDVIFKNVEITYEEPIIVTDQETKITTIDNDSKISITTEQIKEITQLIGEIREKIIG